MKIYILVCLKQGVKFATWILFKSTIYNYTIENTILNKINKSSYNQPLLWNNAVPALRGQYTSDTDIGTSKSASMMTEVMSGEAKYSHSYKHQLIYFLLNYYCVPSQLPPSKLLAFFDFTFCKKLNCPKIKDPFYKHDDILMDCNLPVWMWADLRVGHTRVWHQGHVGVEEHGTCARPGHVTHPIGLEDAIHVLHVTVTHPVLTKTLPEITFTNDVFDLLPSFTPPSPDKSSNVFDKVCSLGLLFPFLPVRLKPLHSGLVKVRLCPLNLQEPQDRDDSVQLKNVRLMDSFVNKRVYG